MKYYKYINWSLIFCHLFIAMCACILCAVRLHNEFPLENFIDYLWFYGLISYLIIIAVSAFISGILLIVKRTWGRVSSIVLGCILLPFGIFLLIINFNDTAFYSQSFTERIIHYFKYFDALLYLIDWVCIFYGISMIIFFTRKNIKEYLAHT